MTAATDTTDAVAALEVDLPDRLAVGRGTALALAGYAYVPGARARGLRVRVDGSTQQVARFPLPRQDLYERARSDSSAFRSGFATVVDVAPPEAKRRIELTAVLEFADGHEATAPLGSLTVVPGLTTPADVAGAPFPDEAGSRVAICMATYDPPEELLRRQLDSIREQTHRNWICLISDDASSADSRRRIEAAIDGDPRFVLSAAGERLGFYGNFERSLAMAPAEADFVTLCDQDDRWHPDKLERLLGAIGDAELVYSDARIINPADQLVRPSYWTERRNNHTNFGSLLLANSVTGAASLFRRELLDDALPFPPRLAKAAFHDHWLAVVAMARGRIAYVDEPLWDYVQHERTVIGHSRANKRPRPIRRHLIERLRNPTGGSRAVYYYDWHQQLVFWEVLRLRCWPRMSPAKRRTLRRLLAADSGVAGLAWLLGRRARRLWGHDETLDRELFYAHALVRRRAVSAWTLGGRWPNPVLPRDQSVPLVTDR